MVTNESLLQELHQHYRDTCDSIGKIDRLRDRYTLYTMVTLSILLLGAFGTVKIEDLVSLSLKSWLGQDVLVTTGYLRCILWFALFAVTLKYFSAVVQRERLLKYIHSLEDSLNRQGGEEFITREGKSYLSDYPLFQNWVCVVYTWIFPLSLLAVVGLCLAAEMHTEEVKSPVLIIDCVIGAFVVVSTSLYFAFLHWGKNMKEQSARS